MLCVPACAAQITLFESLAGFKFELVHLDGHRVVVCSEPGRVTPPEDVRQLRDEGMPVLGNSHVRGALFISFEVKFPERLALTDAMKKLLGGVLGAPAPPRLEAGAPERMLEEVDREAREARERLAKQSYDSDEEEGGGARGGSGVQCAQQ